jgi:HTH-type transcriptional regulator / antitoxin HigA
MVTVDPIRDDASYEAALLRIEALMDAEFGTPEGDELDVRATLVAAYEESRYPLDAPSALGAIEFIMDQKGYRQKDFAALIGKARASEILSKKRGLSMKQAQTLHKEWGVPAEALLAG